MYASGMKRLNEARKRPIGARRAQARRWNLIAVVIAVVTGLGAALLPLGMSSSTDSNGLETSGRYSSLSNEGAGVLVVVAIPAVLVAIPLMLRGEAAIYRSRVVIVVLLGVLVFLAALSIGVFFVPTLIAMAASLATHAAARPTPPPPTRA